jgi:hypothetical protein
MHKETQLQESRNRIKYFEDLNEDVPCNSYKIKGEDNIYLSASAYIKFGVLMLVIGMIIKLF